MRTGAVLTDLARVSFCSELVLLRACWTWPCHIVVECSWHVILPFWGQFPHLWTEPQVTYLSSGLNLLCH